MLALLALACLADPLQAQRYARREEAVFRENFHFVFHLGARALDDEDSWEPVDGVGVLGFEFVRDFQRDSTAGLGFELGTFAGAREDDDGGADVAAAFVEASIGVRGRVNAGPVEFHAGAGPSAIRAAIDIEDGPEDDDYSLGFYVHGGVLVHVNDSIGFGVDARAVGGTEIEFDDFVESDADYQQVTLTFGWSP